MNVTIRLASLAALVTFWLAAIVWTVLIVAAPANAQTGIADTVDGNSSTSPQSGSKAGTTSFCNAPTSRVGAMSDFSGSWILTADSVGGVPGRR